MTRRSAIRRLADMTGGECISHPAIEQPPLGHPPPDLCPRRHAEFVENAANMRLNRALADDQLACNLGICQAPRNVDRHLSLARGQHV